MEKNYYETLGVDKDAPQEDIKRAYRKLAVKYHPDRQGGKSDREKAKAADKMKEINEAYGVLSDEKKRHIYDMGGMESGGYPPGGDPFTDTGGFGETDEFFKNFADSFFGGMGFGFKTQERNPEDVVYPDGEDISYVCKKNFNMDDMLRGISFKISYKRKVRCKECNGKGGSGKMKCPYCHGTGFIVTTKNINGNIIQTTTTCPHCNGIGFKFENNCKECNGTGFKYETVDATITLKPGEFSRDKIFFGQGSESRDPKKQNGNLHVYIPWTIDLSQYNITQFPDIHERLSIPIAKAVIGGTQAVDLPGQGEINLNIPPLTSPYGNIKVDGAGGLRDDGTRGNFYYDVRYIMPDNITEKQKKILKRLFSDK